MDQKGKSQGKSSVKMGFQAVLNIDALIYPILFEGLVSELLLLYVFLSTKRCKIVFLSVEYVFFMDLID